MRPAGPHRSLPGPDFCLIFSRRALPFSRLYQGTSAFLAPKAQIPPKRGKQDNGGVTRQPLRACRGRHSRHPVSPPRPATGSSLQAHPLPSLVCGAITAFLPQRAPGALGQKLGLPAARRPTGASRRANSCSRAAGPPDREPGRASPPGILLRDEEKHALPKLAKRAENPLVFILPAVYNSHVTAKAKAGPRVLPAP